MTKGYNIWLDEVLTELGLEDLELTELEEGLELKYDPSLLTVEQANQLISYAERDAHFEDYGMDVKKEVIYFNHRLL